jgi:hypothetical protein
MRSSGLRDTGVLLLGAGIGAGLMFLLDPRVGNYRRALIRDKSLGFVKSVGDRADRRTRDLINRARGQAMEWRAASREGHIDDDTLLERVRAQIGHVVSNPGSLEIETRDGCVFVHGPVLNGERASIEKRLGQTRGVERWDLGGLVEHDSTENIPGLQGRGRGRRKVVS